jgi:hypothetical protein
MKAGMQFADFGAHLHAILASRLESGSSNKKALAANDRAADRNALALPPERPWAYVPADAGSPGFRRPRGRAYQSHPLDTGALKAKGPVL